MKQAVINHKNDKENTQPITANKQFLSPQKQEKLRKVGFTEELLDLLYQAWLTEQHTAAA